MMKTLRSFEEKQSKINCVNVMTYARVFFLPMCSAIVNNLVVSLSTRSQVSASKRQTEATEANTNVVGFSWRQLKQHWRWMDSWERHLALDGTRRGEWEEEDWNVTSSEGNWCRRAEYGRSHEENLYRGRTGVAGIHLVKKRRKRNAKVLRLLMQPG